MTSRPRRWRWRRWWASRWCRDGAGRAIRIRFASPPTARATPATRFGAVPPPRGRPQGVAPTMRFGAVQPSRGRPHGSPLRQPRPPAAVGPRSATQRASANMGNSASEFPTMEEKIRIIDELDAKVGGRFRLTALLQKRIRELVAGAPRLVEIRSDNPIDVAIAEVRAGKVELVPEDAE